MEHIDILDNIKEQSEQIRPFFGLPKDSKGQTTLSAEIRAYLNKHPLSQAQIKILQRHSSMHLQKTAHVFKIACQDTADSITHHLTDAAGKKIAAISMAFELGIESKEDTETVIKNHQKLVTLCRVLLHNAPIIFDLDSPKPSKNLATLKKWLPTIAAFVEENKGMKTVAARNIDGEFYTKIPAQKWQKTPKSVVKAPHPARESA